MYLRWKKIMRVILFDLLTFKWYSWLSDISVSIFQHSWWRKLRNVEGPNAPKRSYFVVWCVSLDWPADHPPSPISCGGQPDADTDQVTLHTLHPSYLKNQFLLHYTYHLQLNCRRFFTKTLQFYILSTLEYTLDYLLNAHLLLEEGCSWGVKPPHSIFKTFMLFVIYLKIKMCAIPDMLSPVCWPR